MSRYRSGLSRKTRFENLESRIVFSVDSLPVDLLLQGEIDTGQTVEFATLADAHQSTGADYVFSDYGFDGSGQTIAIIDSGIAWDHYALGGGFGEDYRVVGGWDFAEGDANPYDDGPAGFHGTHVAGIVGSNDAQHQGVAAGVDLVGLRVFDDNGTGNLEWVEQALQWVHDHKDDFANPITTVNLSLGVDWNADYLPGWATLEDEFAQLEADDIFISVAAGNSFSRYNETGLAYPAVSDHVVPVASHGADGSMSDFSQRNDRVIAAPGESILSSVPDHLLGASQHDSWLKATGTSMAAPYTAGASAVLREAMQFMGYTNIDQDALYDHFRNTADQIYDSVTGGVYHRLNLGRAVDAIVQDLHGAAESTATNIGIIQGGEILEGTIGKLTDVDALTMTAGASGQLTLTLEQSHDLNAVLKVNGELVATNGNHVILDVVAGANYTVSLSTDAGLGHYEIGLDLVESVNAFDLGTGSVLGLDGQSVNGEAWYSLTTVRSGILTGSVNDAGLQLEIYDQSMNLVSSSNTPAGMVRADATVEAGGRYYVKVTGQQSDFDLRLLNQVSLTDGVLSVSGSAANDHIVIDQDSVPGRVNVVVADMHYEFAIEDVAHINVDGGGGVDHLELNLGGAANQLFLSADRAFVTEGAWRLASGSFDSIHATGNIADRVTFLDSAGDDTFRADSAGGSMHGNGFRNTASGFGEVTAVSRNGNDTAELIGTAGSEAVFADGNHARMAGPQQIAMAIGFNNVSIDVAAGIDSLVISGSAADDQFALRGQSATAKLPDSEITGNGFESIIVISGGGNDTAQLSGTAGDDVLYASSTLVNLAGSDYANTLLDVAQVTADVAADAGHDTAFMTDSAGNDHLVGRHDSMRISGSGYSNSANGFQVVTVIAEHGGTDQASFTGSSSDDTMFANGNAAYVWGSGYLAGMIGFETITVDGGGGNDTTLLRGTAADTLFQYSDATARMSEAGFTLTVDGFGVINLQGGGGQNSISLDGFASGDQLSAHGSGLLAWLDGVRIEADEFIWLDAIAEEGVADLEIGAVDFWYALHGQWE